MVNGTQVYDEAVADFNVAHAYAGTAALGPGGTIDFVVGFGTDGYCDYDATTVTATVSR